MQEINISLNKGFIMVICYYINEVTGSLLLEYSDSAECSLIKDFKEHEDVHSYELLSVEDKDEYHAENAYADLARHVLVQLKKISNSNDKLEKSFYHLNKGTSLKDACDWLHTNFGVSVRDCEIIE